MAVSHKDWKLLNSWNWFAKIDIESILIAKAVAVAVVQALAEVVIVEAIDNGTEVKWTTTVAVVVDVVDVVVVVVVHAVVVVKRKAGVVDLE